MSDNPTEDEPSAFATESIKYEDAKAGDYNGFEESQSLLIGESTVAEAEHTIRLFLEGNTTDLRDRIIHAGLDAGLSEDELNVLSGALSEIGIESMEVVASLSERQARSLSADLEAFAAMLEDEEWCR